MADTYYSLKEALKQTTPAVVVLETYGIKEFDPHTMSGGSLSDQLKSYSARKNIIVKLESTPFLFTSDNYLSAWSNTIRNHDFLYTNKEQLEKNAEIISDGDEEDEGKLYLGRYLRFKTGIEPETLKRYEEEGAPVKGEDYHLNEYAEKYVDKIVKLCESKNIDLIFLTLPMYYKHIEDYDVWKGRLGALLNKYDHPWIDMQEPYDTLNFSTHCFENTYNLNQHMSYMGSLIASYKLADFIREQGVKLPDHSKDRNWHTMFYAEEGYFKNYPPVETDKKNVLVAKDLNFGGLLIKELSMLEATSAKPMIQVKIDRSRIAQFDLHNTQLQLLVEFRSENQLNRGVLQLGYDMFHTPTAYAIYAQHLSKPVEILGVNNARLVVASPPVAQQDRK